MEEMIRKQVYIEPRQERLLKERARRYRVTEADLIRQAIDRGARADRTIDPRPRGVESVQASNRAQEGRPRSQRAAVDAR